MSIEKRVERLLEWLRGSDGFYLSGNVGINECKESGRGVVLKSGALKKNDKVVTVPSKYQLHFNSILWNISLFNPRINVSGVTMSDDERKTQRKLLDDTDPRFQIYSSIDQETLLSFTSFQLFAVYILTEWIFLPRWSNGTIESFWQPFFDVWPSKEELGSIPAIWSSSPTSKDKALLPLLPLASQKLLENKIALLRQDWDVINPWLLSGYEQVRQEGCPIPSQDELYESFLHVYFIINSRCLYSKVHLKENDVESQFTMVPFVDFLNHTEGVDQHCYPKVTRNPKAKIEVGAFSLRCGDNGYSTANEEILLNYGPHSNDFLLNEYGFVLQENCWNFIDITDEITDLAGDDPKIVNFLKKHGYWGNYTINHSELSYRALVALSLIITQDYRRVEKLLLGHISEDYFLPRISDNLRELLETLIEKCQDSVEALPSQSGEFTSFSAQNIGTIYYGYIDILEQQLGRMF